MILQPKSQEAAYAEATQIFRDCYAEIVGAVPEISLVPSERKRIFAEFKNIPIEAFHQAKKPDYKSVAASLSELI